MKTRFLATLSLAAGSAVAHDGHGLQGAHWHAADAWGWLALAAAVALGLWWRRGK